MPDCHYCDESFADEEAYLDHLATSHDESELSRIDQRRVADRGDDDSEFPTGPVILVGLLLFSGLVLAYVTFFVGGGDSTAGGVNPNDAAVTPGAVSEAEHEHGSINVTIDGTQLEFTSGEFIKPQQYPKFHFEDQSGQWHKHAPDVTLQYAMATLGIWVTASAVEWEGTTYDDSDPGTDVRIRVDGESVDPAQYRLEEGDNIEIVVATDGQ
jgi:hypothetical protein